MSRRTLRLVLFGALALFLALVLGNVLGLWASETSVRSPRGYIGISHGDHAHYVPNGWTGEPGLDAFPMQEPPPGMTVAPDGQIVPAE